MTTYYYSEPKRRAIDLFFVVLAVKCKRMRYTKVMDRETKENLKEMLTGKYAKLALITLLSSVFIYLILLIFFKVIGIEFPQFLHIAVAVLGSALLVSKYISMYLG